jgi:NADH-quinone oxidoreductase subunit E
MDANKLNTILDKYQREPSSILAILQDIQDEENYLPKDTVKQVAKELDVPLARIYALSTFFSSFSLEPRGKHICTVCMGTACHVRGAPRLVEHIEREFDVAAGETTKDMQLTLETVNCVGACALGPLVILDGEYHGNTNPAKLDRVFRPLKKEKS